jgi:hypothetical protein
MSMRRSCCTVIALVLALQLPVRSVRGQTPVVPSSPSPPPPVAAPISGDWTRLSGYADRVSVQPGDTLKFRQSAAAGCEGSLRKGAPHTAGRARHQVAREQLQHLTWVNRVS